MSSLRYEFCIDCGPGTIDVTCIAADVEGVVRMVDEVPCFEESLEV